MRIRYLTSSKYASFEELPSKRWDVVTCDIPWFYPDGNHTNNASERYRLMPDRDVLAMDVKRLYRNPTKAVLFMWATCPRLDFAVEVMGEWGFFFRGVAFVWVKTRKDGVPMGAKGIRPSFVKPTTELVLVGSSARKGRPLPIRSERVRHVIMAAPEPVHSRKPVEFFERIEELYGYDVKKLEMFSRQARPGWDAMGDELLCGTACGFVTELRRRSTTGRLRSTRGLRRVETSVRS